METNLDEVEIICILNIVPDLKQRPDQDGQVTTTVQFQV